MGDDLTMMILQFAMFDREARRALTGDPTLGLAHLYHEDMFRKKPGVEVTGAGRNQVNGWYDRKTAAVGPPAWCRDWHTEWTQDYPGHYYEKDDGCYISCRRSGTNDSFLLPDDTDNLPLWEMNAPGRMMCYVWYSQRDVPPTEQEQRDGDPPAQGWKP